MKRRIENLIWYNVILTAIVIGLLMTVTDKTFADDDRYLKINRSIDIFGRVYQEIINNYVDEIDPEIFIRAGIEGMLGALDPYTVYIDENGRDEVNMLTTGRYSGVGITIGVRKGLVAVTSILDGYAAEKEGIKIGDRLIMIDSVSVEGLPLSDIRAMFRGETGTTVHISVERKNIPEPLLFKLTRESIRVTNVSYAGVPADGIVYVRLDRFSRGAGGELRQTLRKIGEEETIEGVILDLRNNAGGLLDAAVDVTNLFVPRGTHVVSTLGRTNDSVRRYVASQEPLLPDIPLVVLINENSASSSEIVAGAIQDLDRGVIVGTRSFGKGLVQTVAHLTPGAQLKVTTSRYYTPSGRSIQRSDYLKKAPKGLFDIISDSLTGEYQTDAGRIVYEGGGILPDTVVTPAEKSRYVEQIDREALMFRFVTSLINSDRYVYDKPEVDELLLKEFSDYIKENDFEYRETSEEKIEEIRIIAMENDYPSYFIESLDILREYVSAVKKESFNSHKEEIRRELKAEIALRYEGAQGKIKSELEDDPQFLAALDLIKNKSVYMHQLTIAR